MNLGAEFVQDRLFDDEEFLSEKAEVVDLSDSNTKSVKVAKSNLLVEAHYDLSPMENKLMLLAMANIRRDQTALTEQVFEVRELCDCLGIRQENAKRDLKRLSRKLMGKQLEIRDVETDDWKLHQWVSTTSVQKGKFVLKFDDSLKPYLLGLVNRFTQYQLECVLKMTSSYAIRLYELLKQVETIGSRTFAIDPSATTGQPWGEFSRLMGYSPKTYKRFSNVTQRILNPAIEQLERYTEFENIEVFPKKQGRKVVAITIKFHAQPVLQKFKESPLYQAIRTLGISNKRINDLISRYDTVRIERNLDYVKSVYGNRPKKELASLFVAAVKDDYVNAEMGAQVQRVEEPRTEKDTSSGEPVAQEDWENHPVYGRATNKLEVERIKLLERKLGIEFESYNEYVRRDHEERFKVAVA